MVKITNLPKTHELSDEDIKNLEKSSKEKASSIDWDSFFQEEKEKQKKWEEKQAIENAKTEKFETIEQKCKFCDVNLMRYYKREFEPWNGIVGPGGRRHAYWQHIDTHCVTCGLVYNFSKPSEFSKNT